MQVCLIVASLHVHIPQNMDNFLFLKYIYIQSEYIRICNLYRNLYLMLILYVVAMVWLSYLLP